MVAEPDGIRPVLTRSDAFQVAGFYHGRATVGEGCSGTSGAIWREITLSEYRVARTRGARSTHLSGHPAPVVRASGGGAIRRPTPVARSLPRHPGAVRSALWLRLPR